MKKRLALFLGLLLIATSIVGCSENKTPSPPVSNDGETKQPEKVNAFPEKDLKVIVPFAPGGAVDVTVRFLSEVAPTYLDGKKIIVENMEGGGAVVGQSAAAKAKADGHTILAYTSSVVTNSLTKQTDYTYKSFQPVIMYCYDPEVLVVPADSKFNTLEEFIEYGKTTSISINTPGNGTSHHIAGMILEDRTGIKFDYIHNDGAAMQITQLLGNHVDAGLMVYGEAKSQIMDGKIKALGIMNTERNAEISDVPTFKEKGIDIDYGAWRGLAVPADTPKEVVDTLAKAFEGMAKDPQLVENFRKAGYPLVIKGPEEFGSYVEQNAIDLEKMMSLLK